MSDDLISRKVLLETLTSCNFGNASTVYDSDGFPTHISIVGIIKIIGNQPTAFDKEKVHSDLIKLRNAEVFKPDFATKYEKNWSHGRYSAFLDAIRIVEKGGIE